MMKGFWTLTLMMVLAFCFADQPATINRILNSGDGKSPETAFEVYSITEEYQLIDHLNLTPQVQMLSIIDGQYYDILITKKDRVYFKLVSKPEPYL